MILFTIADWTNCIDSYLSLSLIYIYIYICSPLRLGGACNPLGPPNSIPTLGHVLVNHFKKLFMENIKVINIFIAFSISYKTFTKIDD